jgi:hypothetical protein
LLQIDNNVVVIAGTDDVRCSTPSKRSDEEANNATQQQGAKDNARGDLRCILGRRRNQ